MDIDRLTLDNWPEIERLIDARDSFQTIEKVQKMTDHLKDHTQYILSQRNRIVLGAFQDKKLVAFMNGRRWSDEINFNLGYSLTDPNVEFIRSVGSRWPGIVIVLANKLTEIFVNEGRSAAWLVRPVLEKWVPMTSDPNLTISTWDKELMTEIASESPVPEEYHQVITFGLKLPQEIWKFTKTEG